LIATGEVPEHEVFPQTRFRAAASLAGGAIGGLPGAGGGVPGGGANIWKQPTPLVRTTALDFDTSDASTARHSLDEENRGETRTRVPSFHLKYHPGKVGIGSSSVDAGGAGGSAGSAGRASSLTRSLSLMVFKITQELIASRSPKRALVMHSFEADF